MKLIRTLRDLNPGQTAMIADLRCQGAIRRRLVDMGITPGTPVTVQKKAPFGDPIQISIRGYVLSLRREEARAILVNGER